jgi:hypothetical protein
VDWGIRGAVVGLLLAIYPAVLISNFDTAGRVAEISRRYNGMGNGFDVPVRNNPAPSDPLPAIVVVLAGALGCGSAPRPDGEKGSICATGPSSRFARSRSRRIRGMRALNPPVIKVVA